MSDETDVRPGVGGAVRYGYVILTTYHTYLDLSSITDTGYFGYYSITHTIVCVILAKKQYHISIHGYYNVHGTPGQVPITVLCCGIKLCGETDEHARVYSRARRYTVLCKAVGR